ncbi:MAG TPA: sigma-E processing peptidase SpoIIGA [Clostridia bacterium]|nr:sigma-E processing peptidase SpoIIGA [Clostridia bacterium]
MGYVVYIDVFLFINLVMNFTILILTAKLGQLDAKIWRIILASVLGAVYSLLVFASDLEILSNFFFKILFSFLIIISVFAPTSWRKLIRALTYFYLISFVTGGAALAISYFIDFSNLVANGIRLFGSSTVNWWVLLLSILILLVAGKCFWFLYDSKMKEKHKLSLTISFGERVVSLQGLLDTGNSLKDPLSSFPVIIVEYHSIKNLFPVELQSIFEQFRNIENLNQILDLTKEELWLSRLRFIPYSSVGKAKGMMLGFKPDEVSINCNDQIIRVKEVIIAVCNRQLSSKGDYSALLHPALVMAA